MLQLDKLSFPVVPCPREGLAVGLLPVTRVQFEYFLGDTTGFPTESYQEINDLIQRASWRSIPADHPERVFMTAVRPEEVERFALWMGGGYRLPTEAEWRAVDAALGVAGPSIDAVLRAVVDSRVHPAARAILGWSLNRRSPATWRTTGLFEHGLLEWVRRPSGGFGLHGRPAAALIRLVHNPQVHPAVEPRSTARHPAFGFRLVRPWSPNPRAPR